MHHVFKSDKPTTRQMLYWAAIVLGLTLAAGQFLVFISLLQGYTAHAQAASRFAGWEGQPVGTMPQPGEAASANPPYSDHNVQHNTGNVRPN